MDLSHRLFGLTKLNIHLFRCRWDSQVRMYTTNFTDFGNIPRVNQSRWCRTDSRNYERIFQFHKYFVEFMIGMVRETKQNWKRLKFMDEMSAPDHSDMKRALIPPFLIVNEKNPMFNTKKLTSDSFDANYSIHWNLIDSNMKVHNTNLRSLRERV